MAPPDWLFSLQVSKTLPLDGRLSFYAFNAFDLIGSYGWSVLAPRGDLPRTAAGDGFVGGAG